MLQVFTTRKNFIATFSVHSSPTPQNETADVVQDGLKKNELVEVFAVY